MAEMFRARSQLTATVAICMVAAVAGECSFTDCADCKTQQACSSPATAGLCVWDDSVGCWLSHSSAEVHADNGHASHPDDTCSLSDCADCKSQEACDATGQCLWDDSLGCWMPHSSVGHPGASSSHIVV
eukprot:gnl/TRDRNA2_/TRDRNA2_167938_c1_seq1.p1 gnl/TRDRNA2_/TRDRNA2_167938_c1~~gnl/TRDRNA2_/TRDRNA2_167938_c1_seq1.p1  ORF type:complete len:129 (-),score=16.72 gnl/TRDRNA2_/TRDRNA2_167938_c1_seq1:36-422(-)